MNKQTVKYNYKTHVKRGCRLITLENVKQSKIHNRQIQNRKFKNSKIQSLKTFQNLKHNSNILIDNSKPNAQTNNNSSIEEPTR